MSGRASVFFLSVCIWMSHRVAKCDWSEGQTARDSMEMQNVQTCREADRQAGRRTVSEHNFTVQWDVGRRFRKKSKGSVYVSSPQSCGEVASEPLSRVTDYRSLMLPRRLPRLAEMNHPSAFFCKPSITSDFSHRSPTPRTRILTHTHALEEDTAQNLAGDEFCWRINSNSVRTPPPLIACSSLSAVLFSSFFSHSHMSLYLSFHWQPSFLSPSCSFLTFFFSSLHLCVLLVTELISSPLCFVPQRYISLLCLAGHFATQHHRASKSLLTF